jgi:hypothetical protein
MVTTALPRSNAPSIGRRQYDNFFFPGMAFLILIAVLVGFARTYFLAGVFRAPLPNILIHIHGAAFSCWIALLITQTLLISTGRVDIHRRLGLAGFGLACLMVILGVLAGSDSLGRGFAPPGSGFDPRTFYIIPLADMVVFAVLVFFAFRDRFNPSAHKRLILIATIALMDAPTGRPPFGAITNHPYLDSVFIWIFLLLMLGYDLLTLRKVHRATIWAGLFVVIVGLIRVPIGMTSGWLAFATWAQGVARSFH